MINGGGHVVSQVNIRLGDTQVFLTCLKGLVTKNLLKCVYVPAVAEKGYRKRMAEKVRVAILDAGSFTKGGNNIVQITMVSPS